MWMEKCSVCQREYKPSSGHKICPKCRYKLRVKVYAKKKPCPTCGKPIFLRHKSCKKCTSRRSSLALRERRKKAGLCLACGRKEKPCGYCAKQQREYRQWLIIN